MCWLCCWSLGRIHCILFGMEKYRRATTRLLSHAAFGDSPRMVEVLLEYGTPIAHTAALHTAAGCGKLDTMRLLMQHGADVNEVPSRGYHGDWTPMHFAAFKGQVDAMKLLEEHGARSDVKDVNGKTATQVLEEQYKELKP
jgi:hypothetical protein